MNPREVVGTDDYLFFRLRKFKEMIASGNSRRNKEVDESR